MRPNHKGIDGHRDINKKSALADLRPGANLVVVLTTDREFEKEVCAKRWLCLSNQPQSVSAFTINIKTRDAKRCVFVFKATSNSGSSILI